MYAIIYNQLCTPLCAKQTRGTCGIHRKELLRVTVEEGTAWCVGESHIPLNSLRSALANPLTLGIMTVSRNDFSPSPS